MIIDELFEATAEIPIASGVVNPATGRVWLPSELKAAQDAEQVKQATAAAQTQAAQDKENAAIPLATSSTAPTPTSVKYSGMLAPKQKKATPNFAKTGFTGYKMPGTPSVPTVPNMTRAPAKTSVSTASADNSNQQPSKKTKTGGKVAGAPLSQTPNAIRKRAARAAATTPVTEPNSMDNMSRQLAARGQAQTSTGGATIATGTGVRHAASPTNPNQTTAGTPTTLTPVNTGMQDIINRLTSQIRTIKNKDDLKKIKQNIDREFTRKGVVSESAFIKRDILVKRANAKLARMLK